MNKLKKIYQLFIKTIREFEYILNSEKYLGCKLNTELNNRILEIREKNSRKIIMEELVPVVIKDFLHKENFLITPAQALPYAIEIFKTKFIKGEIDTLYSYIGEHNGN